MQPSPRLALGMGVTLLGLLIGSIGVAGPSARATATGPLVALSIADGKIAATAPVFGPRGAVVDAVLGRGLAVDRSTLYLKGGFEHIGGKARHQLAALDTRTARANSWDPHPF